MPVGTEYNHGAGVRTSLLLLLKFKINCGFVYFFACLFALSIGSSFVCVSFSFIIFAFVHQFIRLFIFIIFSCWIFSFPCLFQFCLFQEVKGKKSMQAELNESVGKVVNK